jgi:hypothetical protein
VIRVVSTVCVTFALAGCSREAESGAPPRATDRIAVEPQTSTIAVPVEADLNALAAALEREVPRALWTIDKPDQTCLASKRTKVLGVTLKSPRIGCRIVGQVTRGPLALSGRGRDLVVTMPLHAEIAARDVGGLLKGETATGDARVHADVRLSLTRDWQPRGAVDIRYDWTTEPGIDFLGQRIVFTSRADAKLKGVIARLERTLPRELEKLRLRQSIEQVWGKAFTSLELNRANPPVWMRITPRDLRFGGYRVERRRLRLDLGMTALTETFVGDRPKDPPVTPLPPLRALEAPPGDIRFYIPVIADYRQLEPVVRKALMKRSARPFVVPGIGPIDARFGKVTIYGTTGGRIAVGADFEARDRADRLGPARGTIWITGRPVSQPDSRRITFSELQVGGSTGGRGTDLLLQLANAPALSQTVAQALAQDFERDYNELLGKVERAITEKREGDFVIRARVTNVRTGELRAAGQGLYLPVIGQGTASIALAPR